MDRPKRIYRKTKPATVNGVVAPLAAGFQPVTYPAVCQPHYLPGVGLGMGMSGYPKKP